MKLILPVELSPPFQAYNNIAHPLSILYGNAENPEVWGFQHLIQVQFITAGHNLTLDLLDFSCWPCFEKITLGNEDLKQALQAKYYLDVAVNERYILGVDKYHSDFVHDLLIYGYDGDEKVYYALGYMATEAYHGRKVDESRIIEGMQFAKSYLASMDNYEFYQFMQSFGVRIKSGYSLSLSKRDIIFQLSSYLNASAYVDDHIIVKYYGITVLDGLMNDSIALRDHRNFRFLLDHKNHLAKLIHEVLGDSENYELYLSDVVQPAQYLLSHAIKYQVQDSERTKEKMCALLAKIKKSELEILDKVIRKVRSMNWTDRQIIFR